MKDRDVEKEENQKKRKGEVRERERETRGEKRKKDGDGKKKDGQVRQFRRREITGLRYWYKVVLPRYILSHTDFGRIDILKLSSERSEGDVV